jgi:hypothetical protein
MGSKLYQLKHNETPQLMIPEIAIFWVISTALIPESYHCRSTKKSVSTDFSILFESAKASLILKCLELKFRLAFVPAKNCVALVFKEMDHCCVVCCISVQI